MSFEEEPYIAIENTKKGEVIKKSERMLNLYRLQTLEF